MMTTEPIQARRLVPRRSERRDISARVQYRRSTVRMAGVTLDMSRHGVRLAAMERLRIGEALWITLPGLPPRRATVKWVDRFDIGCEFDDPLHPAVFEQIICS